MRMNKEHLSCVLRGDADVNTGTSQQEHSGILFSLYLLGFSEQFH